jgi:hypothetical protein
MMKFLNTLCGCVAVLFFFAVILSLPTNVYAQKAEADEGIIVSVRCIPTNVGVLLVSGNAIYDDNSKVEGKTVELTLNETDRVRLEIINGQFQHDFDIGDQKRGRVQANVKDERGGIIAENSCQWLIELEIPELPVNSRAEFIDQLNSYKEDMERARNGFDERFGSGENGMKKRFIEAFKQKGPGDFNNYSGPWSESLIYRLSSNSSKPYHLIFSTPASILDRSIRNLREQPELSYQEHVRYFQRQMADWRSRPTEFERLILNYIDLRAEQNAIIARDIPYEERQTLLRPYSSKLTEAVRKIRALTLPPVFDYTIGEK